MNIVLAAVPCAQVYDHVMTIAIVAIVIAIVGGYLSTALRS